MPKRPPPLLTLATIVAGSLAIGADAPEVPAFARDVPKVAAGEPVLAFNGKDLTGFYVYTKPHGYADPKGVFTVADGMIRVSGEEFGGFATGGNFRDYHLITEWKWGDETFAPRADKARDSGILLHCVGPDGAAGGQWMESIECQIIEGGSGDFIMVPGRGKPSMNGTMRTGGDKQLYFDPAGETVTRDGGRYNWWGRDPSWKDVKGFRGARDVEKPAGEWNRMEVICDGDTITNILNGFVVNVGTKSSLSEGKIQFQSEGAELFFRRIEVRPLAR
jgi:hypothetical protein